MKKIKILSSLILIHFLCSCGGNTSNSSTKMMEVKDTNGIILGLYEGGVKKYGNNLTWTGANVFGRANGNGKLEIKTNSCTVTSNAYADHGKIYTRSIEKTHLYKEQIIVYYNKPDKGLVEIRDSKTSNIIASGAANSLQINRRNLEILDQRTGVIKQNRRTYLATQRQQQANKHNSSINNGVFADFLMQLGGVIASASTGDYSAVMSSVDESARSQSLARERGLDRINSFTEQQRQMINQGFKNQSNYRNKQTEDLNQRMALLSEQKKQEQAKAKENNQRKLAEQIKKQTVYNSNKQTQLTVRGLAITYPVELGNKTVWLGEGPTQKIWISGVGETSEAKLLNLLCGDDFTKTFIGKKLVTVQGKKRSCKLYITNKKVYDKKVGPTWNKNIRLYYPELKNIRD